MKNKEEEILTEDIKKWLIEWRNEAVKKAKEDFLKKIDEVENKFKPITDVNANSFMDLRNQIFEELKNKLESGK